MQQYDESQDHPTLHLFENRIVNFVKVESTHERRCLPLPHEEVNKEYLDRIRAGETNGGPLIQERKKHGRGDTPWRPTSRTHSLGWRRKGWHRYMSGGSFERKCWVPKCQCFQRVSISSSDPTSTSNHAFDFLFAHFSIFQISWKLRWTWRGRVSTIKIGHSWRRFWLVVALMCTTNYGDFRSWISVREAILQLEWSTWTKGSSIGVRWPRRPEDHCWIILREDVVREWRGGGDGEGELKSWTFKEEYTSRCSSTEGRETDEVVCRLLPLVQRENAADNCEFQELT